MLVDEQRSITFPLRVTDGAASVIVRIDGDGNVIVVDTDGNAPARWSIVWGSGFESIPQPHDLTIAELTPARGSTSARLVPVIEPPEYRLMVDWDDKGDFAPNTDDIWHHIRRPVEAFRGRDLLAQRFAFSTAGRLTTVLDNADGRYSVNNPLSPLRGKVLPGRRVRLEMYYRRQTIPLWEGRLLDMRPAASVTNRTVRMIAVGSLERLQQVEARLPVVADERSVQLVERHLLAAGLNASEFEVDTSTATSERIVNYYPSQPHTIPAIHDLALWEGGLLRERADGVLRFDGANFRRNLPRSHEFTDRANDPGKVPLQFLETSGPTHGLVNQVELHIRETTADDATEVVWEGPDEYITIDVPASAASVGVVREFRAAPLLAGNQVAIHEWIEPEPGTDFKVAATTSGAHDSSIPVRTVFEPFATGAILTFRSFKQGPVYIRDIQLRGKYLEETILDDAVVDTDDASIETFGQRPYPSDIRFLRTRAAAEFQADTLTRSLANPTALYRATFDADLSDRALVIAQNLEVSDRTLVETTAVTGINETEEYFVEHIKHMIGAGGQHSVTMVMSSSVALVGGLEDAIVLGTGPVLGVGKLGR